MAPNMMTDEQQKQWEAAVQYENGKLHAEVGRLKHARDLLLKALAVAVGMSENHPDLLEGPMTVAQKFRERLNWPDRE